MKTDIREVSQNEIGRIIQLVWNSELKLGRINKNTPYYSFMYYEFESFVIDEFLYDKGKFYGAYLDDKLVGVVGAKEDYIMFLYVDDKYQNKGIGNDLLRYQLQLLKNKNIDTVYLDATIESISFYEKNGFNIDNTKSSEISIPLVYQTRR